MIDDSDYGVYLATKKIEDAKKASKKASKKIKKVDEEPTEEQQGIQDLRKVL